ncbi:hypothetical protein KKC94_00735 [Patescibacteria group bacterium]|nr:hypothetical protein [Patescibacteria group bacterium]
MKYFFTLMFGFGAGILLAYFLFAPVPEASNEVLVSDELVEEVVEETEVSGAELLRMEPPYCLSSYSSEKFTLENVLATFPDTNVLEVKMINDLFEIPEFLDFVRKSSVLNLCNYNQMLVFSFLGNFEEGNNVIGVFLNVSKAWDEEPEEQLITDFQSFKPLGDIYACSILGYVDRNVIYTCGGGDGCGAYTKVYALDLFGESKLIKDCDYGCAVDDWAGSDPNAVYCREDLFY